MPINRTPNGFPIPGSNVVACDAIAYLSGVNYGSVVKVLAAIDAVSRHAKYPVTEIALFDAVPTVSVNPAIPTHKQRLRNTDMFVRELVRRGVADDYPILDVATAKFRE